jgi:hypothetical protein
MPAACVDMLGTGQCLEDAEQRFIVSLLCLYN